MAGCPSCGRPVAMVRPRCLYCGAALPDDVLTAATEAGRAESVEAAASVDARTLLVLHAAGAEAEMLAPALGVSAYEAGQRLSRGGYQLLRVLEPEAAEAEAARLTQCGLRVHTLAEALVREARAPRVATGGGLQDGVLAVRTDDGARDVAAGDVTLVVKGPIAREYQAAPGPGGLSASRHLRRVRTASLDSGLRVHLHLRGDTRPLELDPAAFDFGGDVLGVSAVLQIADLVAAVAEGAPVDDDFRRHPPALAPALPVGGPLAAADALRAGGSGRSPILDNLLQFRDYSAWRGVLEKLRAPA